MEEGRGGREWAFSPAHPLAPVLLDPLSEGYFDPTFTIPTPSLTGCTGRPPFRSP